ncbi:hypothetical protein [Cardinium endosymbiont of Oedothorax gibbosus]|uniref:hypothetical protein n=1 Tax=Cardinium endosymbiont of Oedothorax gibbosus TaxID=931101 RepID=UPI0020252BF2|nr:hypothetical protein [Cardinium endosymbiont of Oedothorax gibbosus]CAH2559695.1 hypothetical protein CAOEGIBSW744_0156 [Cardinium endosymbiont of Oedothorax gibbosus]
MGFFVCKSETEIKVIMVLIFWGIQWLYKHLTASDGSTVNEELDEDQDEIEVKDKDTAPITPLPITKQVVRKAPQAVPLHEVVAKKPQSSRLASSAIEDRKVSFGRKRKLFRHILLVDALMQRKDFIA